MLHFFEILPSRQIILFINKLHKYILVISLKGRVVEILGYFLCYRKSLYLGSSHTAIFISNETMIQFKFDKFELFLNVFATFKKLS